MAAMRAAAGKIIRAVFNQTTEIRSHDCLMMAVHLGQFGPCGLSKNQ